MPTGVPDVGQAFLPCLRDLRVPAEASRCRGDGSPGPARTAGKGVGDVAQRGVVELGRPFGEVLHQQIPYGPALDAVLVDDLLDAAASFDPQRPQPRWRAGGQHASVLEQRVEQRPASAAPEVMLLQSRRQLDAVADGDVADQAALADHHPGELAQGIDRAQPIAGAGLASRRRNRRARWPPGPRSASAPGVAAAATGSRAGSPARPLAGPARCTARRDDADGRDTPSAAVVQSNPAASAPLASHGPARCPRAGVAASPGAWSARAAGLVPGAARARVGERPSNRSTRRPGSGGSATSSAGRAAARHSGAAPVRCRLGPWRSRCQWCCRGRQVHRFSPLEPRCRTAPPVPPAGSRRRRGRWLAAGCAAARGGPGRGDDLVRGGAV